MDIDVLDRNIHRIANFIEHATIKRIFLSWLCMVIVIGFIYFGSTFFDESAILYRGEPIRHNWKGLLDTIYFSFMTAAPAGYGDIIPTGLVRIVSIFEVVFGFVFISIFISKLVSAKQDITLEELYRISFDDKINRLRSALSLFRSDCAILSEKIMLGRFTRDDAKNIWVLLTSLDTLLADTLKLVNPKNHYLRQIDSLRLELLLNSIDLSLTKLITLLANAQIKLVHWKTNTIEDRITSTLRQLQTLTEYCSSRLTSEKAKERLATTKELMTRLEAVSKKEFNSSSQKNNS